MENNTIISVSDLSVWYGNNNALKNITLKIKELDFLGIIGPNGGGKTTLLKSILGLIKPQKGFVKIFTKNNTGGSLGYVPQVITVDKRFPITLLEVVLSGLTPPSISPLFRYKKNDYYTAEKYIDLVGLSSLKTRQISELSGGEFQKMLIARALSSNPQIILLDEPTANVDTKSRDNIFEILKDLNKSKTIIMVTHDTMAVSSYIKSLACLNRTLVYHGDSEITPEVSQRLYGCPIDLIAHGVPHRVLKDHN
jgi:zinc transport system ATP-binding protein